jgi:hypothetical protein
MLKRLFGSCKKRHLIGTYRFHHQGTARFVLQLLDNTDVLSSSPIRVTLMMAAIRSSETSEKTEFFILTEVKTSKYCVRRLLVMANVPSSPILVTLIKEALISSETSGLTRATRRNIREDGILQGCVNVFSFRHNLGRIIYANAI